MTRFISLGGGCQTSHQIRVNGVREKHVFDEIMISMRSQIHLIETDFASFMDPARLVVSREGDRIDAVIDEENGIHFAHDFKDFSPREVSRVSARYRWLADQFLSMLTEADEPPCFVRVVVPKDGPENEAVALRLFMTLRARRKDCRLIYLHEDVKRPEVICGPYRSAYVPSTPGNWAGDGLRWKYILNDFAVRDLESTGYQATPKTVADNDDLPANILFKSIEAAVDYAWSAYHARRWEESLRRWNRVRAQFPDYQPPYVHASTSLLELGRLHEAASVARLGYERFPQEPQGLAQYARLLDLAGEFSPAVELLQRGAWQFRDRPEMVVEYIMMAERRADRHELVKAIELARELHPSLLTDNENIGRIAKTIAPVAAVA